MPTQKPSGDSNLTDGDVVTASCRSSFDHLFSRAFRCQTGQDANANADADGNTMPQKRQLKNEIRFHSSEAAALFIFLRFGQKCHQCCSV